jgi:uncharacterized glyoxalase superfamily metalloenzyme YdcJ
MRISKNQLRKRLFRSLSEMYAAEVPLYDKLLETVLAVNRQVATEQPDLVPAGRNIEELSAERHGAIRLGKPEEMRGMARFFACLDMYPVNFYNLAEAGAKSQPIISTAFRPLGDADHRVFCSLLMTDYFDHATRERVESALKDRRIFPYKLLRLIEVSEQEGDLSEKQSEEFIGEARTLFSWRGQARDHALYRHLVANRVNIAADIACFPNPHLNHLTPNTLDIDRLYAEMSRRLGAEYAGFDHKGMKDSIEGPPRRKVPILLRQTSYKALDEKVVFTENDGTTIEATHTARFGEIEERGIAMTPEGRARYDAAIARSENGGLPYAECFSGIPDDFDELWRSGLIYIQYKLKSGINPANLSGMHLEQAIGRELVACVPVRYEDFLPVSAAGIFASNLEQYGTRPQGESRKAYSKGLLESYLDFDITESDQLYAAEMTGSLNALQSWLAGSEKSRL